VGALLEPPVDGGTVGPTAQCILADVFYRIRFGDRFFFDVRGQPGSYSPGICGYSHWYLFFRFTIMYINYIAIIIYLFMILLDQLRTLRNIDLGHVICATTELDEVPFNIFKTSK